MKKAIHVFILSFGFFMFIFLAVSSAQDKPQPTATSAPSESAGASAPQAGTDVPDLTPMVSEVQSLLEPFIYDPQGRSRDPFRPYTELKVGGEDGTEQVPLLPLQRFELDQLKLIGIIWDVHDPKAMFLDPNAEVYVVSKDERIGRKNGYIATIREGEVVVVEASRVRGEIVYTSKIVRITR